MNFEQLRSLRAVATEGGFSRAAEALYLSQSTISMQIAALEKELGVRLFERLGRRVVLTRPGEEMVHYATHILALMEESSRSMAAFRGLEGGELGVGASLTIGSYVAPSLFGRFRRMHPNVRLVLDIAPTHRVAEQVALGNLDLGLVEGPVDDSELVMTPFQVDELVVIVPIGHPWASRGEVSPGELAKERYLEREPGSGTREIVQGRLSEQGVRLTPILEMGSPEALKQAVLAGLGVAIVSRATVEVELAADLLAAVSLRGLKLTRPFQTVLHRDKHLSPPLAAFLELLRNQ